MCSVPVLILFNFLLCPFLFHVQFSFSILLISTTFFVVLHILFVLPAIFCNTLMEIWVSHLPLSLYILVYRYVSLFLIPSCSILLWTPIWSPLLSQWLYIKKNLVFSTHWVDNFFLHSPISCLTFSLGWHHWLGVCWVEFLSWESAAVVEWVSKWVTMVRTKRNKKDIFVLWWFC